MKKVLLVATVQCHICQFHKPLVKALKERGIEVHVAARDNLAEKNGLKLDFVDKVFNVPFKRFPFSFENLKAYKMLKKIIDEGNYDVIHCNTPVGGVLSRLAAKKARKKGTKVYYMAHGFHFYKGAPLKNWLLWYPIEKSLSKKTDKLITIVSEDENLARKKHFKCEIVKTHGVGINSERYNTEPIKLDEETAKLFDGKIVGICTGELNKNKNQSALIKAMPEILNAVPNFILLFAGNGPKKDNLIKLAKNYDVSEHVVLLGYRTDLYKFVKNADFAFSVSIREGLGLNLIEAMACGKVVIGSNNRGHREFIKNGENGFILQSKNIGKEIAGILQTLLRDEEKRKAISSAAIKTSMEYTDEKVYKELREIYFG